MAIDKINSNAITDSTVVASDIAPGTITSEKLAGSIANAKLANSTVTINGESIALGASAGVPDVQWQSVVTSNTTMVAGRGYFANTTSGSFTLTLPSSAAIGDTIRIKDYAGTFGTNALTIGRNSHNIQGVANDGQISTNRAALMLVYVDSTKGWLYTVESNVADLQSKEYVAATGGTVTTSGDFKVHTFTGDSNFVVSAVGNAVGSNSVAYLVAAGGGGAGASSSPGGGGGGGGGGGFREGKPSGDPYSASPLVAPDGIAVSVQTYPITVGGGGTAAQGPRNNPPGGQQATNGSNSVFSTITSAGGGFGGINNDPSPTQRAGGPGGSGGGSSWQTRTGGTGNTPPVSPAQGTDGGNGSTAPTYQGGPAGGATEAGTDIPNPTGNQGKAGGAGATSSITGSPVGYSGGGGGGGSNVPGPSNTGRGGGAASPDGSGGAGGGADSVNGSAGATNRGGGGGGGGSGSAPDNSNGGAGGSGVVILRYKFQN